MPDETHLVSYAEHVAALILARSGELTQLKLDLVMRMVNVWMRDHGMSLALDKMEIVVLTKKRIEKIIPM